MAHERKCFCCGVEYQYCAHGCKEYDPLETWRYLVHDYKCKDIYDIWQQYRGKEITKEAAKAALEALGDLSYVIHGGTPVVPVLKEILDIVDEEEEKPEEVVEPVEADSSKEEVKEEKEFKNPSETKEKKFDRHNKYNKKN